jgi:RHS repeat-associated protein
MRARRILNIVLCVVVLISCELLSTAQTFTSSVGQARTLLPDGRTLVTGGLDTHGQPSKNIVVQDPDGSTHILPVQMAAARVGHAATVLPDGTVLISGGIGSDKHLVAALELFDPASESVREIDATLVPRAFHTATVTTNGQLVVIGGVTEGGIFTDAIQVWNYQTRSAITIPARLLHPRIRHSATLLANGTVLISGGKTANGNDQLENESFVPAQTTMVSGGEPDSDGSAIQLAESVPADKATNIDISHLIVLRFTSPAIVTTATSATISLSDVSGNTVPIQVVAAEAGRLAFILPATSLLPGTNYQLAVSNISDHASNLLPTTTIHFQTAGISDDNTGELWIPGPDALKGNWNSQSGGSRWQKLQPLRAPAGVTAVSGQVLRLNGLPLAGVLLSIGSSSTKSDSTGRFLLKHLSAGHQVLTIDGRAASRANAEYGLFEVGVDVSAKNTNILNYAIWMTRLDSQHAVVIPSPTTAPDTVITTPLLPGLEFHLPANTVIVDHEGHPTSRLTITPIPLDKPPFPLPLGVAVPIYFTIQPGGSYVDVRSAPSTASKGGRLVYPNSLGNNPGAVFDFWNYDAESRGWYVYGQGKVTNDGRQIVPNPGVLVYELTGAMVGSSGPAPGQFPTPGSESRDGEPVDLSTGIFEYDKTDLFMPDILPLRLQRTYRTNDSQQRPFGIGATHNYDFFMVGDTLPYTYQELIEPNGSRIRFNRVSPGTLWMDAVYTNTDAGSPYYGAILTWNASQLPGAWLLTLKNGTRFSFPDAYNRPGQDCQAVMQITDRYNNAIKFQRDNNCVLQKVVSPSGRFISFQYDTMGRISYATDSAGRTVGYQYDSQNNLHIITDANGKTTILTYDSNHNMLTITDPKSITYLTNEYDSNGRVYTQTQADGSTYHFAWTASTNSFQSWQVVCPECQQGAVFSRYSSSDSEGYAGLISAVDVTDPRGYVRHVGFNSYGYAVSDSFAVGQPEQETFGYAYYADDLLESVTDALNRTTTLDYDGVGNNIRITRLATTPSPITTTVTYTPDFNQIASATDPLGHVTTFKYDQIGNPTTVIDPLGHQTKASYYSTGQLKSLADGLGDTISFGYSGGDLSSVTDALGNQELLFEDLAGRLTSVVDPTGNSTKYQYDNLNQLLAITDSLGGNTGFDYDENGNVKSVSDPNGHTNSYTYNIMDRPITRQDPLSRSESYNYDPNGNLVSLTDRKLQVSNFTYDGLNRLTGIGFGVIDGVAQSSINYRFDAGNRIYQAVDSLAGTTTRGYDALDRLTSEATPQNSIGYTYDNAGRRLTMQVLGQQLISYAWDDSNRLTGIVQGSSNVAFSYDGANRRASVTLPNGIVASYSYDGDSHLTGISYMLGNVLVGNQSYSYDQMGRRVGVTGSLGSDTIPQPVTAMTYDEANELKSWNGISIAYDADGNMVNDGTHIYSWDARNHLGQIDSGNTASFVYDPFGRRASKSIYGGTTEYMYDGVNAVQESSGGTPTANMLAADVDEYFARTDSVGTVNFLTNAVGSTLALTDVTGALLTQYAYEPFGTTTSSGVTSTNSLQYAGRENDQTGIYYVRARYYHPQLQRFISEDPIGYEGGLNFYSFDSNDPLTFQDPSGETTQLAVGGGTSGNPFGHVALIVDNEVFSYGTHYTPNRTDWGQDAATYLASQDSTRETSLMTLNLSPDQEANLLQALRKNDPNNGVYNLIGHTCVTPLLNALRDAAIVPSQPGPIVSSPQGDLQAGAPSATTPQGLGNLLKSLNLVTATTTTGTSPLNFFWRTAYGVVNAFAPQ